MYLSRARARSPGFFSSATTGAGSPGSQGPSAAAGPAPRPFADSLARRVGAADGKGRRRPDSTSAFGKTPVAVKLGRVGAQNKTSILL